MAGSRRRRFAALGAHALASTALLAFAAAPVGFVTFFGESTRALLGGLAVSAIALGCWQRLERRLHPPPPGS